MKVKTVYNYSGIVLGNLWGGGKSAYTSIKESGFNTIEELQASAENHLKKGSLDSGMGYESLIGALLLIETVETVKVNGKDFINKSLSDLYIGELTEKEIEFLDDCSYNM